MRYLVDTNAWIGFVAGAKDFGRHARESMESGSWECCISLASVWEASIKVGLGKLKLPILSTTTCRAFSRTTASPCLHPTGGPSPCRTSNRSMVTLRPHPSRAGAPAQAGHHQSRSHLRPLRSPPGVVSQPLHPEVAAADGQHNRKNRGHNAGTTPSNGPEVFHSHGECRRTYRLSPPRCQCNSRKLDCARPKGPNPLNIRRHHSC